MIPSGHRRSSDIGDSAYVVMKPGFQNNIWIQQIFYLKKMKIYFIYDVVIAKAHATLGKFDAQLGNFQDVRVCLAHSLRWDAFIYVYLNWKKHQTWLFRITSRNWSCKLLRGFLFGLFGFTSLGLGLGFSLSPTFAAFDPTTSHWGVTSVAPIWFTSIPIVSLMSQNSTLIPDVLGVIKVLVPAMIQGHLLSRECKGEEYIIQSGVPWWWCSIIH